MRGGEACAGEENGVGGRREVWASEERGEWRRRRRTMTTVTTTTLTGGIVR